MGQVLPILGTVAKVASAVTAVKTGVDTVRNIGKKGAPVAPNSEAESVGNRNITKTDMTDANRYLQNREVEFKRGLRDYFHSVASVAPYYADRYRDNVEGQFKKAFNRKYPKGEVS